MATIGLTTGMRSNLISMQDTTDLMETIQKRLSTGKKVSTAIDNPTNYFTASNHLSRADKLDSKKDLMNEAIQTATAASSGIDGIKKLIESARGIAQSALTATGTQLTNLQTSYNNILGQMDELAADSKYKGKNLLDSDTIDVVFNEDSTSKLTIEGFDGSADGLGLSDVDWSSDDINDALTALDDASNTLETNSATLAANLNVVQTRFDFTTDMINTLRDGAAKLTDADLNEEGANLLMLQTRQQLGATSMSLASQAAQSVLRLF